MTDCNFSSTVNAQKHLDNTKETPALGYEFMIVTLSSGNDEKAAQVRIMELPQSSQPPIYRSE